jgi:hypothetical protein
LQPLIRDLVPAGEKVRSKYRVVAVRPRGAGRTLCASKFKRLVRFTALAAGGARVAQGLK